MASDSSLSIRARSALSRLSLRRIITSNRFIPEVDGFRFIAVLIVVISHVYVQCGPIPGNGAFARGFAAAFADGKRGVYLFFTISGFIMALPFARHHLQQGDAVSLRSYFRRRLTRLEPPYVLAMLLRLPLVLLLKHGSFVSLLKHFLASIFYLHNLIFSTYSTINPPAWSLEIEIQFYVLAPLLACVFLIRNRLARRVVLLGSIVLTGTAAHFLIAPDGRVSLTLLNYVQDFLGGFFLCDLYLANEGNMLAPIVWDLAGIGALAWILFSNAAWFSVLLPFATLVLYLAGFHGRFMRRFFAWSPISLMGGMCYSLYLTHSTVLAGMTPLVHRLAAGSLPVSLQSCLIFGGCLAAVLIVGTVYFVLIERPCMDPAWPHKLAVRMGWR